MHQKMIITEDQFVEKDILYRIDLRETTFSPSPRVKVLRAENYQQWKALRMMYLEEYGMPNLLSDDEMESLYIERTKKSIIWGYFLDHTLVSIGDLNALALDLGQVGGVFTHPEHRKKGYSKEVMKKLFYDSKKRHSLRKLIIFTGESNLPARRVYDSLGVESIGHYALFFGSVS